VSALQQAPPENFRLDHITIQAQAAGPIADARNWTLSQVTVDAADGSKVTFSDSKAITLNDDQGIEAPAQEELTH
jgi:hypothetical protein